jgi:hypothetical protein
VGKFLRLLGLQEAATTNEVSILHQQVEGLTYRLQESFAQLELSRDNAGYLLLGQQYANEFTREGLVKAAEMGRIFGVANPLIKRGREMRHAYVHGQGCTVDAKDPKVNVVIQAFQDDDGIRESLYGAQA